MFNVWISNSPTDLPGGGGGGGGGGNCDGGGGRGRGNRLPIEWVNKLWNFHRYWLVPLLSRKSFISSALYFFFLVEAAVSMFVCKKHPDVVDHVTSSGVQARGSDKEQGMCIAARGRGTP